MIIRHDHDVLAASLRPNSRVWACGHWRRVTRVTQIRWMGQDALRVEAGAGFRWLLWPDTPVTVSYRKIIWS